MLKKRQKVVKKKKIRFWKICFPQNMHSYVIFELC